MALPTSLPEAAKPQWQAFDALATLVAVVSPTGDCLFANASFESVLGLSRRALTRRNLLDWLTDPRPLRDALAAVARNDVATCRFDTLLRRPPIMHAEALPVHAIVNQTDDAGRVLVEFIEIEQQTRQEREARAQEQMQANKELIRNLAHEIKNPLGGIRGAAQLLAMDLPSPELLDYTQVIIHEADRLQALVDRLLAPHRRPQVLGAMNIHEVCERVRALLLAEHPKGLQVLRDYDTSLPDFMGDREQLIQAVLNIAHNAAQALAERLRSGDAEIAFRTRVLRQVTVGKQRHKLALELRIEDNGPGIPEALRDRIFFPLISGREGGSGLGLTLAQTFVQAHHGHIECESVPGRTVFKLLIPITA